MKGPPSNQPPPENTASEPTGVPGLRSWNRVYAFVLAWFVVCVLLLLVLTEVFG